MIKSIVSASLYSKYEIEALVLLNDIDINNISFYLLDKDDKTIALSKTFTINEDKARFILKSEDELSIGNDYLLVTNEGEQTLVEYDEYLSSKEFEEKYRYFGKDLGATYTKKFTTFKVYSPLASALYVKLEKSNGEFEYLPMERMAFGVFALQVKGDLANRKYLYFARINRSDREFRDPYGRGMSANSEYSVVINLEKINKIKNVKPKNEISGLKDKVIYEVDIRDFTNKITKRATYSEFIKKIPYLSLLGVTYVQLLPILDFDNVDELQVKTYNWGYDPLNWFSIEGSYADDPETPLSRMIEFKTLVNELHKAGIRVIIDVVYNHVYGFITSDWEKSFPGYYFRKNDNGKLCNGSGCGNDYASEKPMARKMIIESLENLITLYDVDGFRFDLLGLLDIETSKQIIFATKNLKEDILLYGEGWDMLTNLERNNKSSINNAHAIPQMGFFNPRFRDLIKGDVFDKSKKGYASGELSIKHDVEDVLLGSYRDWNFVDASQVVNFVECHDNGTLYDKLSAFSDDKNEILKRTKFANALTILSLGIPFLHMGQEIGQTKFGLDNTYNTPNVNNMDWDLFEKRSDMVNYIKDLVHLRKTHDIFNLRDKEEIKNTFDIYQHDSGLMTLSIIDPKYLYGNKEIIIIVNPTERNIPFELNDYFQLYFNSNGLVKQELLVKNVLCSHASIRILVRK